MQLGPFRIEQYYAEHEFTARYMLSSSDCESRTVGELLELEPGAEDALRELWCGYTESPGAPALRAELAAGYDGLEPDDVLVTSCAEEGIFLVCHALLRPGDHAVVETPCYESALELSRSTGAEVSEWRRRHDDGWTYDLDELGRLVRAGTRLIYVNTPHNPTGSHMTHQELAGVVEIARGCAAVLFCDEVYRDLEHEPELRLPAACEAYERAVSLGSMSKSLGLPGLRLGWLASRDRGAAGAGARPQALHDDLLERTQRAAEHARAAQSADAARPQPGDRPRQPGAAGRPLRAPRRHVRVGAAVRRPDRLPADRRRCGRRAAVRIAGRLGRRAAAAGSGVRRAASCPRRLRPPQHAGGAGPAGRAYLG